MNYGENLTGEKLREYESLIMEVCHSVVTIYVLEVYQHRMLILIMHMPTGLDVNK